jgi:hypothetical protein
VVLKKNNNNSTEGLESKEFFSVSYGISMYLYGSISVIYVMQLHGLELGLEYSSWM